MEIKFRPEKSIAAISLFLPLAGVLIGGCKGRSVSEAELAMTQTLRGLPYERDNHDLTPEQEAIYGIAIERIKKDNESVVKRASKDLSVLRGESTLLNWVLPDSYSPELQRKMVEEIEDRYPEISPEKKLETIDILAQMGEVASATRKLEALAEEFGKRLGGNSDLQLLFLDSCASVESNSGRFPESLRAAAQTCLQDLIRDDGATFGILGRFCKSVGTKEEIGDLLALKLRDSKRSDIKTLLGDVSEFELIEELGDGDAAVEAIRTVIRDRVMNEGAFKSYVDMPYSLLDFCRPKLKDFKKMCPPLLDESIKAGARSYADCIAFAAHSGDIESLRYLLSEIGISERGVSGDWLRKRERYEVRRILEACVVLGPESTAIIGRSILSQSGFDSFAYSLALEGIHESEKRHYLELLAKDSDPEKARAALYEENPTTQIKREKASFLERWRNGAVPLDDIWDGIGLGLPDEVKKEMLESILNANLAEERINSFLSFIVDELTDDGSRGKIFSRARSALESGEKTGLDVVIRLGQKGYFPAIAYCLERDLFLGDTSYSYGYDELSPAIDYLLDSNRKDEAFDLANRALDGLLRISNHDNHLDWRKLHIASGKKRWSDIARALAKHGGIESLEEDFVSSLSVTEKSVLVPVLLAELNNFRSDVSIHAAKLLFRLGRTSDVRAYISSDLQYSSVPDPWSVITGLKVSDHAAFEEMFNRLGVQNFDTSFLREPLNRIFREESSREIFLDSVRKIRSKLPQDSAMYADALLECPSLQIYSPFRLSPKSLIEAVRQRSGGARDDTRPLAVYVSALEDWNGALNIAPVGHESIFDRFQVMYFEVKADRGAARGLKMASLATGKKCRFLMMNGHGRPSAIAFGEGDPAMGSAERTSGSAYLDFSDADLIRNHVAPYMDSGSVTFLLSCSVGGKGSAVEAARDKETEKLELHGPLSNFLASTIYFNKPGTVYGPRDPISGGEVRLSVDRGGNVLVFPRSKIAAFRR